MPNGSFGIMTKDGPGSMSTEDLFSGKKVALFSKSDSNHMVLRGVRLTALRGCSPSDMYSHVLIIS